MRMYHLNSGDGGSSHQNHKEASSQKRAPQSERTQVTNKGDGRRTHKSVNTRQVVQQNNCKSKKTRTTHVVGTTECKHPKEGVA
ncbi:hypothetical protein JTE90_028357 [Oedothorax gibbosus]|uniref:Uncharacterized protein n=1 Tax=Oedothorax gibbosus TaxID=931172 RepID=A0AAV6TQI0_9ARAC|nr:hypothetical protein JTE90_028357 [Oedothorax gibbosus]